LRDISVSFLVMSDLYRITGLASDVSPERLRYVYEAHVADAARARDHRRLLELSRAFDALPRPIRNSMYPTMSTASPGSRLPSAGSLPASGPRHQNRMGASRKRKSVATTRCRQPVTRQAAAAGPTLAVLLGLFQFAHATHLFGGSSATTPPAALMPVQPESVAVDSAAIAVELDRANGRDDISCSPTDLSRPAQLSCHSSDGAGWSLTVVRPPAEYTVTATTPSVYAQSARFDVQLAINAVQQCRHLSGGTLPPTTTGQVGQAHMACGGGISTLYLRPGDQLDYRRINRSHYRLTVTAANGEVITYTSATGKITP
jgi:hypothetical protein